ncbi:hypothetical protein [Methylococcus capsulatus]|uniref:hypothetical protein n=1 Tax=Methylococcus capsulatus TaxID=414 RepID=UPI001C52724C|nr:hypothetical protein [Methylococcus capsulatus]QXP91219.1 hypothetical protein KW114_03430 [Methylococcus capsulatus]
MKTIFPARTIRPVALTLLLAGLHACEPQPVQPTVQTSAVAEQPAATPPSTGDFPTLTRVEYVLQCMQEHGGQNYDNMYHCACAVDVVAKAMTADEYDQAVTFTNLFGMGGERGAVFRDPPQSEQLRKKLKDAKAAANDTCFPKMPGSAGSQRGG